MNVGNLIGPTRTAFISTYPPRKCGIATFTEDIFNNLKQVYSSGNRMENQHDYLQVIAMNDSPDGYAYSKDVSFSIREQYREDYRRAADYINLSPIDLVCLQHEFGIFGGEEGSYILQLLGRLKKPVVTTLHTIPENPPLSQKKTLEQVCSYSTMIAVIAHKAVQLLQEVYGVPPEKIVMIPHGAHDVPFLDSSYYKEQFKAEGRQVILTFGLIDENKGIEYVIDALPEVVKRFPQVLFLVLGATHPGIKKLYGEKYRHSLQKRVREKNLTEHVVFHNQYVSLEQLIQFLVAADIYVTPYLGKERISSGTLAYALACGKAIISTPYNYAEELIGEDRGIFVPFEDSQSMAEKLILLLENENLRNRLRKNAYQFGRNMVWREVANKYALLFESAVYDFGCLLNPAPGGSPPLLEQAVLPDVNLNHLRALTDDTGMFNKALYTIPDRFHGYTTDDNARALAVIIMNYHLFRDKSVLSLMQTYFSFLNYALDKERGRMKTHMSYDRQWLDKVGNEDSHGRSIWALGYAVAHPPDESVLGLAVTLFHEAIDEAFNFKYPRAWAYTIKGTLEYMERFGGEARMHKLIVTLSQNLFNLFTNNASSEWLWGEDKLTYDNPCLCEALIAAGQYMENKEMMEMGLKSLEWLISVQTDPGDGHPSFIGCRQWYRRGGKKSRFDQQPIEATALVDACYRAYLATNNPYWRRMMDWAFNWYFGNNDIHQVVYDFSTGGCFDGLQPAELIHNQGGEAVVSYLLALHRMHQLSHQQALHDAE